MKNPTTNEIAAFIILGIVATLFAAHFNTPPEVPVLTSDSPATTQQITPDVTPPVVLQTVPSTEGAQPEEEKSGEKSAQ